jgi:uncharacterized protein YndB with AHSA1/START domain
MAIHTASITSTASAQKVFNALTQPELVKLWQYGKQLTTDWQVGGKIRFSAAFGEKTLEQWGTVLEVRNNELLRYNLFTPGPGLEDRIEHYNVTSYVLSDDNGGTKIEIIQEDKRPGGFTPATLEGILISLKEIAEKN